MPEDVGEVTIDTAKAKKQMAAEAKKAKAQVESALEDAEVERERLLYEAELLAAEAGGYDLVADRAKWTSDEDLARAIDLRNAAARRNYLEGLSITNRRKAGWAAMKVKEAEQKLEDAKDRMRGEVRRAEKTLEWREAAFEEKVEAFAKTLPRESVKCPACEDRRKKGIVAADCERCLGTGKINARVVDRFPEFGVRLELREGETGGTKILDSQAAMTSLIEFFGKKGEELLGMELNDQEKHEQGLIEAYRLGLVKFSLVEGEAKVFVASMTDVRLDGVEVTPVKTIEKLTIVKL